MAAARNPLPLRAANLGPRGMNVRKGRGGVIYLSSPQELKPYPREVTERLAHWASVAPDRVLLGERGRDGNWRTLTFGEAWRLARRIAQGLLDRGLSPERPVVILSEGGIEHAILSFAAMHVGIPYCAISPAYSLVSTDHGKLKFAFGLLQPGLVFAWDGERFAKAIAAACPPDTELVVVENPPNFPNGGRKATAFADLEREPTAAVAAANAKVNADTVAKFLFTSGSTGMPKAVINTQRMLCSNQQMVLQSLPFLGDAPPTLCEWTPWHHTAAGNQQFGIAVYNGGSYYIDDGKPMPGGIDKTVRNLREIAPTFYFNVPKGYEELLPHLQRDRAFARHFFSKLQCMLYAGAGMSQHIWTGMEQVAMDAVGERVLMISGLGSTETAPSALFGGWDTGRTGVVGIPVPAVEVKLIPNAGKLEARFRGPSITPGYWKQPDITAAHFDQEGFYRMGDALKFVDPADPQEGLLFDGRVSEDFKLATATWVDVGSLRMKIILKGAPLVQDVVITGHDQDYAGAMIFPHLHLCRELCDRLPADATPPQVLAHPAVRTKFQSILDALSSESTGSSNRIARARLLDVPPSIDAGEITDKGSINQRAVLGCRASLVDELYSETPGAHILVAAEKTKR